MAGEEKQQGFFSRVANFFKGNPEPEVNTPEPAPANGAPSTKGTPLKSSWEAANIRAEEKAAEMRRPAEKNVAAAVHTTATNSTARSAASTATTTAHPEQSENRVPKPAKGPDLVERAVSTSTPGGSESRIDTGRVANGKLIPEQQVPVGRDKTGNLVYEDVHKTDASRVFAVDSAGEATATGATHHAPGQRPAQLQDGTPVARMVDAKAVATERLKTEQAQNTAQQAADNVGLGAKIMNLFRGDNKMSGANMATAGVGAGLALHGAAGIMKKDEQGKRKISFARVLETALGAATIAATIAGHNKGGNVSTGIGHFTSMVTNRGNSGQARGA